MSPMTRSRRPRSGRFPLTARRTTAGLAAAAAVSLLAACGGSSGPASPSSGGSGGASSGASASASPTVLAGGSCKSSNATQITFWAWVPGIARAVNAFNASHSSICVTLEDVGAGNPEYVKISDALKAGSGAPDVAEVEFDELPSFEVTHDVVDLVPYGANKYKDQFVPWAWEEVSQGSAVYAMPGDAGPMAFYYNSKLLARYHIKPPATWDEFATAAAALKKASPDAFMTNFAATDLQWVMSLMAQAGAWPFRYSGGSSVTINWTGPAQQKFAAYWQKLIDAHEVNGTTDVSATSFADMDKGIDASWLSSAWGPSYFAPDAKASVGAWRAAALPQWNAGGNIAANWGGSTYPVFKQSQHPAQAAQFSEWLNATDDSWNITKTPPSSLFPTYKPLLSDPAYKDITVPVSGSSHPGRVFTAAAGSITGVPWPPFMTYALTQANTVFAGVLNGKTTLAAAFSNFQNVLVSYAKQQGFTVSTS
jgi:multiple sugar transport system substrate-binding protein